MPSSTTTTVLRGAHLASAAMARLRLRPCFAALAATLALAAASGGAVATASAAAAQATLVLDLVGQDPTTALGGRLDLRLRLTGPIGAFDDLEVRVIAGRRVGDLAALSESLTSDDLGRTDAVELRFADLARFGNGDVVAPIELQPSDEDPDFSKLQIETAGVYPLEVLVRDADDVVLARTVTWLVAVADDDPPTARVAWVWSLVEPPKVELDGVTPTDAFVAAVGPRSRLATIVGLLGDAGEIPISVAAGPQTLEAWSAAADRDPEVAATFDLARRALRGDAHELIATPYVPIDAPTLEADGLGDRVPDLYLEGARTLQEVLGRRPESATVFVDPVDRPSLARAADAFAYRALVRADALAPAPGTGNGNGNDGNVGGDDGNDGDGDPAAAFDEYAPFTIETSAAPFVAVVTADDLDDLLDGSGLPGQRVQHLMAALALVGRDRDEPATVAFATPSNWRPETTEVRAVLAALRDHALVDVVPLGDLFTARTGAQPGYLRSADLGVAVEPAALARAERTLATYESLVGTDDPGVAQGRAAIELALADGVPPAETAARLAAIDSTAQSFLAGIGTESRRVTLTDRRSRIPISFRNTTGRSVEVRVELSSSKLTFPEPEESSRTITLEADRNTTVQFLVEARTSGTFPMRVDLSSADGNLPIGAPTQITVQSPVVGAIGTWLTYGALGFLALWWGHHFWRGRRSRRPEVETA